MRALGEVDVDNPKSKQASAKAAAQDEGSDTEGEDDAEEDAATKPKPAWPTAHPAAAFNGVDSLFRGLKPNVISRPEFLAPVFRGPAAAAPSA